MANIPFLNNAYFAGKVGVGVQSPTVPLDVSGIIKTNTSFLGNAVIINQVTAATSSGRILFKNNSGSDKMAMEDNGNFGIGTTSASQKLHVVGNSLVTGTQFIGDTFTKIQQASGNLLLTNQSSSGAIRFLTNNTERVRITSAGNVGIGTTSPRSIIEAKGNISIFDPSNTLSNGDTLNGLHFYTDEYSYNPPGGRVNTPISKILPVVDSSGTDSFGLSFYTAASDVESSEKLRISSSGNVGIGTSNPTDKLYIKGDNPNIVLYSDTLTGSLINFIDQTYQSQIMGSQGTLLFKTGGTNERMRIDNSGKVGIGTTSPSQKLHINNSTASSVSYAKFSNAQTGITTADGFDVGVNTGAEAVIWQRENSNLLLATNNSERMRITAAGILMVGGTTGGYSGTKIHVGNFTDTQNGINILTSTTGYGYVLFGDGTGADTYRGQITYYHGDDSMSFNTNGSEKLRIVSGGGISFAGATNFGSAGQVLKSNGSASPAWVDASTVIGGPFLPLAGGTMTGVTQFNDHTQHGDQVSAKWGAGNDLTIQHNATNSAIANSVGNLYISNHADDKDIIFECDNGSGASVSYLTLDGSTTHAYFSNPGNVGIGTTSPSQKLEVAGNVKLGDSNKLLLGAGNDLEMFHDGSNSYIENYTGDFIFTQALDDGDMIFKSDNGSGGTTEYFRLDGGSTMNVFSKPTWYGDGVKALFGNSSDLQIYHDGSNSYIKDAGAGSLKILAQDFDLNNAAETASMIRAIDGAQVELYYGGSKKLETTSTGIAITGNLDSPQISVNDYISHNGDTDTYFGFPAANEFKLVAGGSNKFAADANAAYMYYQGGAKFQTTNTGVTVTGAATATTFLGDLNGTINTATTAVTKANATNDTTVATTAFVQNLIGTIPAGLVFQGTWNAATNTPTLTSGSGTTGHFYIVSTDGSTNLDGITDWKVGDWAVFVEQGASDQWEKVDNSSVLDGSGTGQKVTMWSGSGTSNTLTNAPITVNGNNATFAGDINFGDSHFIGDDADDNLLIQGSANENIIIDSADDLILDAGGNDIRFKVNSVEYGKFKNDSGDFAIFSSIQDKDILFKGNDGGSTITALALDMSAGGNATFAGDITIPQYLKHTNDADTYFGFSANNQVLFHVGGSDRLIITSGGNVGIGTTSPGAKLHVQGTSFFFDQAIFDDKVGIGTTSPVYKLDVNGGVQAGGKVTYTKSAGSLNTTGYAVAGITALPAGNGSSCGFTFTCFGGVGKYQKLVYSCYNSAGTWNAKKVIDEGTNDLDVVASANGSTITFTFKAKSSTQSFTPRVTVEAVGTSINSTYA